MPLGHLYDLVLKARAALYRRGMVESRDLGVPVISVGNITIGGTGKTPLVAFAAKILAESERKPCILTRGYKRREPGKRVVVSDGKNILADVGQSGDEPFELAKELLGSCAVIADKDRATAGAWAKENLGVDTFILDDGFQHFKLKRSLDLVTVDAMNPFGNGWLLPQGTLREPVKNLARADAIILTRSNLVEDIDVLREKIQKIAPEARLFISHNKISKFVSLLDFDANRIADSRAVSVAQKVFAFCALGNPENFFGQLKAEGYALADTKPFPDHHSYTQKDITALEELARKSGAELLLTTAKDAVKMRNLKFTFPCYVVENEMVFDDENGLRGLILNAR